MTVEKIGVPCFRCKDRSSECHSECPRYAEYVRIIAETAKKLREKDRDKNIGYMPEYNKGKRRKKK